MVASMSSWREKLKEKTDDPLRYALKELAREEAYNEARKESDKIYQATRNSWSWYGVPFTLSIATIVLCLTGEYKYAPALATYGWLNQLAFEGCAYLHRKLWRERIRKTSEKFNLERIEKELKGT